MLSGECFAEKGHSPLSSVIDERAPVEEGSSADMVIGQRTDVAPDGLCQAFLRSNFVTRNHKS